MSAAQALGKGKKVKNWVGKARAKMEQKGTVGALRKSTGAKKGKKIPVSKLQAMKAKGGLAAKRAQFALNVRK